MVAYEWGFVGFPRRRVPQADVLVVGAGSEGRAVVGGPGYAVYASEVCVEGLERFAVGGHDGPDTNGGVSRG